MKGPPDFVAKRIAEMGDNFNPDVVAKVYEIYRPLLQTAPKLETPALKDISYGPDDRHLLDLHRPDGTVTSAQPAVVYMHGGGFTRGHKNALNDEPDLIHGNIATFFARHGFVGINATYRLAPDYKWPTGGIDVGLLVEYLRDNAERYNIDQNAIFLFGQSAGATHVANYIFDKELHVVDGSGVAGAILFSGAYDLSLMPAGPVSEYYGDDKKMYRQMSAINYIHGCQVPIFLVTSEFDPPMFKVQADKLREALQHDGQSPEVRQLPNHNHLSQAIHLNTQDDSIGPELVKFIDRNKS